MRSYFTIVAALAVLTCGCHRLTRREVDRHVVRTSAYWGGFAQKPLIERLRLSAPPEVLDYLAKDNELQGYSERPRVATISPEFDAEIRQAVMELPPRIEELVRDKVAAVIFVNDLGGSAYTEYLTDTDAGWLAFDVGVLDRPANEWATWREGTPFSNDPDMRIVATIAPPDQNTRRIGVEMILLHELAHVIGLSRGMHPTPKPPRDKKASDFPFFALSWTLADGKFVSLFDKEMPDRAKVHYYTAPGAKLSLQAAPGMYDALETTNLPTLYGATNPLDDFAEAFATYVHTVILKRPWQVQILRDNVPVKTYKACWEESRCRAKRALIEQILTP